MYIYIYVYMHISMNIDITCLLVISNPSEKCKFVSWDDYIRNNYMEKKVKCAKPQTNKC